MNSTMPKSWIRLAAMFCRLARRMANHVQAMKVMNSIVPKP